MLLHVMAMRKQTQAQSLDDGHAAVMKSGKRKLLSRKAWERELRPHKALPFLRCLCVAATTTTTAITTTTTTVLY